MRVLITGSRAWESECKVWEELDLCLVDAAVAQVELIVVHGDCRMGADRHARDWVIRRLIVSSVRFALREERHPAKWSIGKQAGFVRNAEMVKLGADLCLSFVRPCTKGQSCWMAHPHGSHGAAHTTGLARAAGIEVREFREGW